MTIPDMIPVEVSGYCDLETGECVTAGPVASDGKTEPESPTGPRRADHGHSAIGGAASSHDWKVITARPGKPPAQARPQRRRVASEG